jgi:hypothetical protein
MTMHANQVTSESLLNGFDRRLAPNTYVTDGANLFRCISVDRSAHIDAILVLEDCRTLEVILLPLTELLAANVRVVRQSQRAERNPEKASLRGLPTAGRSSMGAQQ